MTLSSPTPSQPRHRTATHLKVDPSLSPRTVPQSWIDRLRQHQSFITIITVFVLVVGVTVLDVNSQTLESLLGLPIGNFSAVGAAETLDPSQIVESDADQGLIVRLNRPVAHLVRRNPEALEAPAAVDDAVDALGMRVHTVVAGNTVWDIAAQHGLQPNTINWSNDLAEAESHLDIGDRLLIPPMDGAVHKILSGDTLFAIATRYEADWADIVGYEFNGLATKDTPLVVGQDLFIPGGTKPPPPTPLRLIQYTVDGALGDFQGTGRFRSAVAATLITQGFWPGHRAIDYAAPLGTPIRAIDHGAVAHAAYGWNGGYGNMVVMDHGNGFTSLYAHLSTIAVRVGERVRQGQVIGAVGSTGKSTGAHLHLEIRLDGAQQNPLHYIAE